MNKKELHYKDALAMYIEQMLTLTQIADQLPVSIRTIRKWAIDDNWKDQRVEKQQQFELIHQDNNAIAVELGKLIKKLLSDGVEPSATVLNSWSRASAIALSFKKFDTEQNKESSETVNDPKLALEKFKETFGTDLRNEN